MTLPKKRQPIADKSRIAQALDAAAGREQRIIKESRPEKKSENTAPKPKKKIGRPSLKDDRTARMTFYLSQETMGRFNLAFPQEQYKQIQKGNHIDKSLILERLLEEWLKKNGY